MGQSAAQLFHGQVCVIPSLSHLQGADKRSRVNFKCAICIWNLLLSTLNMRSKELSLSVKQAIIRLKNQNKPIREIAKTWSDTPSPSRIFHLIAVTPGARAAFFCSGDLKLLSPSPSLGVMGQLCHSNASRPNSALGRGGIQNLVPRCLALANQRLRPVIPNRGYAYP